MDTIRFFVFFLIVCFVSPAFAQFNFFGSSAPASSLSEDEKALRQRAKNRTYPGGRDEEPLKVQPQINFAQRKMMPAQEAPESESETPQGNTEND